jgi:hypothetical protein
MQFKSLNGASSYKAWSKWKVGDTVTGEFVSQSIDTYGKQNYTLKVLSAQFESDAPAIGSNFTLNETGSAKHAMSQASYGDIIKATYQGKGILEKGKFAGKEYHKISFQIAEKEVQNNDDIL